MPPIIGWTWYFTNHEPTAAFYRQALRRNRLGMTLVAIRYAAVVALYLSPTVALFCAPALHQPTYAGQVSRIVGKHCTACHRIASVGPFPLTNYEETRAYAREIRRATQTRKMPPWFAVPGVGEFQNQRQLTVEEIKTLGDWFDAGAPLGDPNDLPPLPEPSGEWAYGQPDLVLQPQKPYLVAGAVGEDQRCFVIPSSFPGPKAIRAMDVHPGAPSVVYHVRAFADVTGSTRRLDTPDQSGFDCSLNMGSVLSQTLLGEWEPGNKFPPLPEGFARYLPKGADIVLEIHYHRTYKRVSDQTNVAFYFERRPVQQYLHSATIVNREIRVPPGNADYHASAKWVSASDIVAIGVTPHMHRLGTTMKISLVSPGTPVHELVWVNRYNFLWQTAYVFKEPILIRKGTTVQVEASYDNSTQNMNLNPQQPLHESQWGNNLDDEMLVVFLEYVDTKARP
jgi:hypothetical protein